MSCYSEDDDRFTDAREEISSLSDFSPDSSENRTSSFRLFHNLDVWTSNPESVDNRRHRFKEWLGLNHLSQPKLGRVSQHSGALSSSSDLGFVVENNYNLDLDMVQKSDDEMDFVVDKPTHAAIELGFQELHTTFGSTNSASRNGKVRTNWLKKLKRYLHRQKGTLYWDHEFLSTSRTQRIRVQTCRKNFKELSSLCIGQEFMAHDGSILTIKFSLDGKYLATAGEDGIVRVWMITQDQTITKFVIPETSPTSLYFTINRLSQLAPLNKTENHKINKIKRWWRSSDSACVVLPPKVFQMSEKPMHEFRGHEGEILDLSWSKNGFLLSSSVDKTVRLWQVGEDRCLGVFSHNDYVTCVAFNPVDDNYFISGSIDGKVRIWERLRSRVVDYTDVREIVTAVCYQPDGKGGIVGSMTGKCRFYHLIDEQLQFDVETCLQGNKKFPDKRVTGFQFSPSNSGEVMVTCVDSQTRILYEDKVVSKLKASTPRSAGNSVLASFTSNGKHILTTNEDSNIMLWNYPSPDMNSFQKIKSIRSCESFLSENTSVAVPWCGIETLPSQCFSQAGGFLLESLMKGSMTWPEEKLPDTSPVSQTMCKSKLKFLRNACRNTITSPHAWGLVIVAATWDGRIRAYHNYGLPISL